MEGRSGNYMQNQRVKLQIKRVYLTLYHPLPALCRYASMDHSVEGHEGYWNPDTARCFLESYLAWLGLSNNGDGYRQHAHANVMLGLKFL